MSEAAGSMASFAHRCLHRERSADSSTAFIQSREPRISTLREQGTYICYDCFMSNSTLALEKLEEAGHYLFHGTPDGKIAEFEPRQAMSHGEKDGKPCVAASEHLDPAIFMAIFSGRASCGWNPNKDSFGFYMSKQAYEMAKRENWKGYVYIFNRSNFEKYLAWEWRAYDKVKPLKKIEVAFSDLPKDIDLR